MPKSSEFGKGSKRWTKWAEGRLDREDLPDEVALLRKALGLGQEQLAEILGVSHAAISEWERGKYEPSAENLILLGNISHGHAAIYFWRMAGLDVRRILQAVGHEVRSRSPHAGGEDHFNSSATLQFAHTVPELHQPMEPEISVGSAARILRLTPEQTLALFERGAIRGRRLRPGTPPLLEYGSVIELSAKAVRPQAKTRN